MKAILSTLYNFLSRRFLSLLALVLLVTVAISAGISCTNSLGGRNTSDDPINLGIIAFFFNPDVIFGNGSDETEVQVSTEEFPDGSAIDFNITASSLPQALRGCFFNADTQLSNGGEAFVNYVGGINIASSTELLSDEPPVETVNIAATVTPPGGNPESDFQQLVLFPVGIIPPEDIEDLVTNPAGDPTSVFQTLEFQTVGLPPGTVVDFSLSRPDLGSLDPTSAPVTGSVDAGFVATQYTTVNNTGGTQVVTATAVLPNPFDINPNCPNVPESQRTIEESVTITQSVPEEEPTPTPAAEICNNGVDDDGDGLTDCQDTPACDGVSCDGLGGVCTAGVCT